MDIGPILKKIIKLMNNIYLVAFCFFLLFSCQEDNKGKLKLLEELKQTQISHLTSQQKLDSVILALQEVKNIKTHFPLDNLGEKFNKCKKSVYLIICKVGNEVAMGSAFAINKNGLCLSNFHVFNGAEKAIAIDFENNKYEIDLTNISNYDKNLDYVLFHISNPKISPLTIATELPQIGDQCFAIGNPEGLQLTLSDGIISGYRGNDTLIQTTAEITHGSSGGPLFNTLGEVIGITSSGMGEANLNFAININMIMNNLSEYASTQTIEPESKILNSENSNIANKTEIIEKYYLNLLSQNYEILSEMYESQLARFFSNYNVNKEVAINDHRNYYSRWSVVDYDLKDTKCSYSNSGNEVLFESIISLTIQKKSNGQLKKFLLKSFITLNSQNKISSIYEEVISKN